MSANAPVPTPAPAAVPTTGFVVPAPGSPATPITRAIVPSRPASRLTVVRKGRLAAPLRYLFYGVEGVGKSTLAAHAPRPIWLDIEDGSGRLDVARYPFRDESGGHVPARFEDVGAALDDLTTAEHDYRTLVIDTVDRLESLIHQRMLTRDSKAGKELRSVEDYGYGKGFNVALEEWRAFCLRLDRLRVARGMSVILLGHAAIRAFKNPLGDDYDRYSLRINDKASGFLKEWADITGFCQFEEGGAKLDGQTRTKGFSTGRRLIKLSRTAAFDAKSRYSLPAEVELDPANPWGPFAKAVDEAINADAPDLVAAINAEVTRIGDDDTKGKVEAAVAEALKTGDLDALHRFVQVLRKREPKQA